MTHYKVAPWEEEPEEKIRIDELFEKAHRVEDAQNSTYNKVLSRVHRVIRMTSRVRPQDRFCFYKFPEVLVGCPMYKKDACVEYVLSKLENNGLRAAFVHPSMLVVSWQHWINDRQRAEIFARTGLRIDGLGNVKAKKGATAGANLGSALMALGKSNDVAAMPDAAGGHSTVNAIEEYKPLGIYEGLGLQSRLNGGK